MTRPPSHQHLLVLGAASVALVATLLAAAFVWQLRSHAHAQQFDATRNLAQSVGQTLDGLVGNIDYVLQVASDEISHRVVAHDADADAINRFLARQQERFPHIDLLRATNAQGEAIWGKGVDPAQRVNLAQRDYFRRLRDEPGLGMVISEPIVGRISQRWIWLMARRIDCAEGRLVGVVYASMFVDDLVAMFEQIGLPPGSTISLRDEQMRIVARTTFDRTPALPVGDQRHSDELRRALQADPRAGSYVSGATTADGVARIYSYRRHPTYGYVLLVGMPLATVTAQWQPLALVVAALLAGLLLGLVYFVKATARRWNQAVLEVTLQEQHRDRARLESLVRTIPDLVWLKDPQGAYLACNAEFERFVGRGEAELVGKTDHDLMPAEQAELFRRHDRAALEAGQARINEEWVTYASDGRRALVKTVKTPMRAADGALVGVLGIAHDITEQRRGEDALREKEEQLQRLNAELEARIAERTAELQQTNRQLLDTQFAMDSVGIGISWVDFESGRFTWANPFMAEFLGYTREEFQTLTVPDIDPNFPPAAFAQAKAAIRDQGFTKFETEHRRKDGERVPVEMTVYYDHRDPAQPPRLIAFMSTIAARKEAERALLEAKAAAESASRAKSAFLANMSHEIRTPLNALLGLNHLLMRDEALSPTQRERLEKMDGAGRHLLSIINDILDLSKVEAGRLQLETSNFHLSAVLDNVFSMVRDVADAKGLEIVADPDGVPHWLSGDPTRLRQALLNFAGNAVKFTDQGRIELRAQLLRDDGDELLVRFEVKDSGVGLSEEQQARLFQPFEQADGTAARRFGGTGLGLALTRRLVELMNGTLGVESQPGQGSTFWFTVPLRRGHGPMPEGARAPEQGSAESRLRQTCRGARVLLAEDNTINVEVVQEMLHAVGLDVVIAENGRQAVDRAAEGPFDLILMDMQMPEMDGLEATRRIRAMPSHAATPIVALTANAFTDDRQACLDAGMDTMLTKPVDPRVLYEAVLNEISRAAASGFEPGTRALTPRPVPEPAPAAAHETVVARLVKDGGLDLQTALLMVGDDTAWLVELLGRFVQRHAEDPARLREEHQAGRREDARQRMHRLKGAAGTLALQAIGTQAAALENMLRHEPPAADEAEQVDRGAAALAAAFEALAEALGG